MALDNDKEAIAVALKACVRVDPSMAGWYASRAADLDVIQVSGLLPEVKQNPRLRSWKAPANGFL